MAEIKPFKAWRYNPSMGDVKNFISPLFDVVDNNELKELRNNPFNSIHLSVPENPANISELTRTWKEGEIIIQDTVPAIYVYYQYYKIPGENKLKCKKGFVCNIRLYEWNEKIILRHENTMPHSVSDRLEILEQSLMNISPTQGLYSDGSLTLEKYMDESIQNPIYELTDYQGVINKMSIIQDKNIIQKFTEVLKEKPVILADGHHRYAASLAFRNKYRKEKNIGDKISIPVDYHCIYLTNTESNDLKIFPTHRLINGISTFNKKDIINKISNYFSVEKIIDPYELNDIISKAKHRFGIIFKDEFFSIELKQEILSELNWNFPNEIKNLDLTIMHFFIIEKVFGIKGKDQKTSNNINFSYNFAKIVSEVLDGSIQMAIITRDISIEEIKRICYSGFTFPHKSTYFYPKVICGLVFSSIEENLE